MNFAKILLVAMLVAVPEMVSGQVGSGCLPPDSTSEILLARITRVTTVSDFHEEREAYKLPILTTSDLALVTSDSVCVTAGVAINATSGIVEERMVHVIQAGSVFVVMDTAILLGDRRLMWVFDADWACLATIAI